MNNRRLRTLAGHIHAPAPAAGVTIDLSGKIAVVTGATGQLGRVMVRTLGTAGADVAVHYRSDKSGAEDLIAELRAMGRRGCAVYADISDSASIADMKTAILAELGDPDIVVTNAVQQVVGGWKSVLEQDEDAYEGQFRTCVMQNVLMAKAFVPGMQNKQWGREHTFISLDSPSLLAWMSCCWLRNARGCSSAHVLLRGCATGFIGINTECAMQVYESQSAYTSGKRGMDAVIRVLAKEVGRDNITVNQVAPGWTVSDNDRANGNAEQNSDASRNYVARNKTPLNRRGTDQEIANAVLFLASDLASYITGLYMPVCGGNEMPGI